VHHCDDGPGVIEKDGPVNLFGTFHLGGWEIIVILAVAIMLLFGKNLGDLARGLGAGREEFNKVWREVLSDVAARLRGERPENRQGHEHPLLMAVTLFLGFVCFVLVLEMLVR
jgi:Sec-independent protein translocase protein TatA